MKSKFFGRIVFLLIFLMACRPFTLKSTLGTGEKLNGQGTSFYGTLSIFSSEAKKVDKISFWNEQYKVAVFEAPTETTTTIQEQTDRNQEIILKNNPAEFGAS